MDREASREEQQPRLWQFRGETETRLTRLEQELDGMEVRLDAVSCRCAEVPIGVPSSSLEYTDAEDGVTPPVSPALSAVGGTSRAPSSGRGEEGTLIEVEDDTVLPVRVSPFSPSALLS
jgi:hypothetical protein